MRSRTFSSSGSAHRRPPRRRPTPPCSAARPSRRRPRPGRRPRGRGRRRAGRRRGSWRRRAPARACRARCRSRRCGAPPAWSRRTRRRRCRGARGSRRPPRGRRGRPRTRRRGARPRRSSRASSSDGEGSCSEGLRMNALPHASATGAIHSGTMTGKLNGVMPATTPSGWRSECESTPEDTDGVASPLSRWPRPQANSTTSRPRVTSPVASESTLPCSRVISAARSSRWPCTSSRNANITCARLVSDAPPQRRAPAAAAARTARSTSAALANGTARDDLAGGGIASPRRGDRPARRPAGRRSSAPGSRARSCVIGTLLSSTVRGCAAPAVALSSSSTSAAVGIASAHSRRAATCAPAALA